VVLLFVDFAVVIDVNLTGFYKTTLQAAEVFLFFYFRSMISKRNAAGQTKTHKATLFFTFNFLTRYK
jgi:hypothetical protein